MTYNDDARCDAPAPTAEDAPCLLPRPPASRSLPAVVEPWRFCLADPPAPPAAVDPAWLLFFEVEPQEATSAGPWVDFFRPQGDLPDR